MKARRYRLMLIGVGIAGVVVPILLVGGGLVLVVALGMRLAGLYFVY